ncbi:sigma-70 family RNA polymerase sigma factor [Pedobacter sp. PWIIR3]
MTDSTLNARICQERPMLDAFAMKLTRDVEDANDLVQDTLIKAIRYAALFKEGTNLKAWLFIIMKNTFINSYRKLVRKQGVMDVCEDLSSVQLSTSASSNLGENKFALEDINKAIKNLPENCSVPFLRYFEGYKYHEIADELNVPIGTVKTRIHMARQMLKASLKMYNDSLSNARTYTAAASA